MVLRLVLVALVVTLAGCATSEPDYGSLYGDDYYNPYGGYYGGFGADYAVGPYRDFRHFGGPGIGRGFRGVGPGRGVPSIPGGDRLGGGSFRGGGGFGGGGFHGGGGGGHR